MTTQAKKDAAPAIDTDAVQQQYIDGIKQVNKTTIDAVSSWVESVGKFAPGTSLFPAAKDVREAATSWFKFNQELLEIQREFALGLVNAVEPLSVKS